MEYVSVGVMMALLPLIYVIFIIMCRSEFREEKNRLRRPLGSLPELAVLILSEASLLRLWHSMGKPSFDNTIFLLMYIMLAGMTAFFFTDLWEHIVPNKLLLLHVLLWVVIVGAGLIRNFDYMLGYLAEYIIGFLFCALSFGLCCIISRGKLGAGDVKLALLLGMYIPAGYITAAVFYGCVLSAAVLIILLLIKKITSKELIPFVPFLYIGLAIKYLLG